MRSSVSEPVTTSADPRHEQGPPPGPRPPADAGPVRRYLVIRLIFAATWGIDATLKWLPGFRDSYLQMIQASGQGQPSWLAPFFHFWAGVVQPAPVLFAVLTAAAETAICLSLLLGVLQRASFAFGAVFGLAIWAVGEGFGGPYGSGSTDIGCAIMYTVLFAALLLAVPRATRAAAPALDNRLVRRWPRLVPLTFVRPGAGDRPGAGPPPATSAQG
jgi:uncharacterized membrane protein YphA (DoxX/SURF4 family)